MTTSNTPRPPQLPSARAHRLKPSLAIGGAVVVALLLLLVVMNIETPRNRPSDTDAMPPERITELISPERLTEEDLASADRGLEPADIGNLPAGGWIQTTDDDGKLSQQYRFRRLDPRPDDRPAGWLQMVEPEAELYLADGRVVTLTGDSALAYAPSRALESGTLTGNVLIRLFEAPPPGADFRDGDPTVIVTTEEASFDNILGEVRCDGWINIEHEMITIPGHGLSVFINDQEGYVRLELGEVDYVAIRTPPETAAADAPPAAAEEPAPRDTPAPAATADETATARIAPADAEPKPASAESSTFYELVLHESVLVRQGVSSARRTVTGDRLRIVFSPDSQDLGPSLALAPLVEPAAWRPAVPALVALAVAAVDEGSDVPAPEEALTVVTCTGGLTIEPLLDPSEHLDSPDDAMVAISGAPVLLTDAGENAFATCDELRYYTLSETLELIGTESTPIEVDSPRLAGGGRRFFLCGATGLGGFVGAGWLKPIQTDEEAAAVDRDAPAGPLLDMRITWTGGVDLKFDEAPDDRASGALRRATFNGDVEVLSTDGSIACAHLDLTLKPGLDGDPTPDVMVGTGNVKVSNPDQTLWADELEVTFREVRESEAPAADDDEPPLLGGRTDVDSLTAIGDVQVLLADGSRAFAERLEGDAEQEAVQLTGSDVVIVSDKLLIDHGTSVELRRRDGTAHWHGPGQARIFTQPVKVDDDNRVDRPRVDEEVRPPQVKARWNESMTYDSRVNDGAGKLDLRGGVEAQSAPSALEVSRMSGEGLALEFAHAQPSGYGDLEVAGTSGLAHLEEGERELARLVAVGSARLENRTWRTEEQMDVPRVFSVAGDHIEYDNLSKNARVAGAGELLIRDLGDPDDPPDDDELAPFSAKGTTLFRWTDDLRMTRAIEDRFDIEMTGDVRALHQAEDDTTATMSAGRLEAVVVRATAPEGAGPPAADVAESSDDLLDFGGPMELRRIFATTDVFMRTETRDVSCQEFDYNLLTGIAKLHGRIAVLTRGTAHPVRADDVVWNMRRDTIAVEGISGSD